MKTIEIKLYKYEELDKQTREKVIENYRYINVEDTFWYDLIKDDFNRLGLEIQEFDLNRNTATIEIGDFQITSIKIIEEFGDSVLIKSTAKNYLDEYNKIESNFKDDEDCFIELEKLDEEYEKEYSADILSYLRAEYEYQVSDEALDEFFINNDFDFTIEGKIY